MLTSLCKYLFLVVLLLSLVSTAVSQESYCQGGACTLPEAALDSIIDKAYQRGYRSGYDAGRAIVQNRYRPPETRYKIGSLDPDTGKLRFQGGVLLLDPDTGELSFDLQNINPMEGGASSSGTEGGDH